MYQTLTYLHSAFRWAVLALLIWSIYRACTGAIKKRAFGKADNSIRHWTATAAHIQLVLGLLLYFNSPVIRFFFKNTAEAVRHSETLFFSLIHSLLMLTAVVVITVGSAITKRKPTDPEKFKTMLLWFSITLFLIFIAIPWPFSPLAARPLLR